MVLCDVFFLNSNQIDFFHKSYPFSMNFQLKLRLGSRSAHISTVSRGTWGGMGFIVLIGTMSPAA